jgi:hypothetical protein
MPVTEEGSIETNEQGCKSYPQASRRAASKCHRTGSKATTDAKADHDGTQPNPTPDLRATLATDPTSASGRAVNARMRDSNCHLSSPRKVAGEDNGWGRQCPRQVLPDSNPRFRRERTESWTRRTRPHLARQGGV